MARCRRPRSETEGVSPHSSSDQRRAIRAICDAPRRADRADGPLSSSSLGDGKRVSSLVLRSAARDPLKTAPLPASGGRSRGSRVIKMPNPPTKLPTAIQPAQAGKRKPKVAASTMRIAYPMPIQPSSAGTPGRPSGGSGSGT